MKPNHMHVESFYDTETCTFSHVVVDTASKHCAVIDSVLDYDQDAARFSTSGADQIIDYIQSKQLTNQWLLETHIHADHISAAHYLQAKIGGQTGIGIGIKTVLRRWVPLFDSGSDTPVDGSQFDVMFEDQAQFQIGHLQAEVLLTPGHTPACATYVVGDALFVGDTLFHPDSGTARVDFPGGSAAQLHQSIERIYQYDDHCRVFLCHDYPDEREAVPWVSLGEQKAHNKMHPANTSLETFRQVRDARDQQLAVPKLILPSIQTNMRLGDFGPAAENGIQYIRIPINQL